MSGKAAAVRALQGWHCAFLFGGGGSSLEGFSIIFQDLSFRGDCIASCGFSGLLCLKTVSKGTFLETV